MKYSPTWDKNADVFTENNWLVSQTGMDTWA